VPPKGETVKIKCRACGVPKRPEEFGWSVKKRRPTKTCVECWTTPTTARTMRANETTEELLLYWTHIRGLMTEIAKAQKEALDEGLPVDRPIAALGDIWVGEMTEEAYRAIVQALIQKASNGDVNAAKLLLEERHRRAGEPTKEGVEEAFADLFKAAPFSTGLDSE
jgi:hypothetical protein